MGGSGFRDAYIYGCIAEMKKALLIAIIVFEGVHQALADDLYRRDGNAAYAKSESTDFVRSHCMPKQKEQ